MRDQLLAANLFGFLLTDLELVLLLTNLELVLHAMPHFRLGHQGGDPTVFTQGCRHGATGKAEEVDEVL